MIRGPPRSPLSSSAAASDVYKRQTRPPPRPPPRLSWEGGCARHCATDAITEESDRLCCRISGTHRVFGIGPQPSHESSLWERERWALARCLVVSHSGPLAVGSVCDRMTASRRWPCLVGWAGLTVVQTVSLLAQSLVTRRTRALFVRPFPFYFHFTHSSLFLGQSNKGFLTTSKGCKRVHREVPLFLFTPRPIAIFYTLYNSTPKLHSPPPKMCP